MAEAVDRTTTVLLVRHAETSAVGRLLSGRLPGVSLTMRGLGQAGRLARALAALPCDAIYTSPLQRAVQTAEAIGRVRSMRPQLLIDAQEADFGEWTGRTFDELDGDPRWRLFNERRSQARVPGGESPRAVQERIVQALNRLHLTHPGQTIIVVSHADVIRFALLHFLERSLDDYASFEIEPISISEVVLSPTGARVLRVNASVTRDPPEPDAGLR